MKKKVVMWMKSKDSHLLPKFNGPKAEAYHAFFTKMNQISDFSFAFNRESYQGDGVFSPIARYVDSEIVMTNDSIQADMIYHYNRIARSGFEPGSATIINSPEFRDLGADKWQQYQYLREYFTTTQLLRNLNDIQYYLEGFNDDAIVVLKPVAGASGQGVIVALRSQIAIKDIDYERLERSGYLGQEFIDTSNGIPGITNSVHDLRYDHD